MLCRFDRSDFDNENEDIVTVIFPLSNFLHLMCLRKKILSNLELCSVEESSKLNKATPTKAIGRLK